MRLRGRNLILYLKMCVMSNMLMKTPVFEVLNTYSTWSAKTNKVTVRGNKQVVFFMYVRHTPQMLANFFFSHDMAGIGMGGSHKRKNKARENIT